MKLLTVIPYCQKDLDITAKLLELIHELANVIVPIESPLLLAADSAVSRSDIDAIAAVARKTFPWVKTMIVPVPSNGWAPTHMFRIIAAQINASYRLPFFWMEPDCIPLKRDWLARLEEAYDNCPRRYLGALVNQSADPSLPSVHMTGCGIYPNDAIVDFRTIEGLNTQAWDIAGAKLIVPKAEHTPLIQHYWGMKDLPPVFVAQKLPDSPKNHLTMDFIRPDAVVFHRSKDGKLVDLVMGRLRKPTSNPEYSTASPLHFPAGELQPGTFEETSPVKEVEPDGKSPGWGATVETFKKMADGSWVCGQTGQILSDKEYSERIERLKGTFAKVEPAKPKPAPKQQKKTPAPTPVTTQ